MGRAKLWGRRAEAIGVDAGADASGCADVDGDATLAGGTAVAILECCFQAASIETRVAHSTILPQRSAPRNSSLTGVPPEVMTIPADRSTHSDPKTYCQAPAVINLFDPLE